MHRLMHFGATLLLLPFVAAYNQTLSFDGGNYVVSWSYLPAASKVEFQLKVKATGWVGFGMSNINSGMQSLDCVVAGVNAGAGYLSDYYATTTAEPAKDASQDYTLVNASESGELTTVVFRRPVATGDNNDMQLAVGKSVYIVWSYHRTSDAIPNFQKHTSRGYSSQPHVIIPAASVMTRSMPLSPTPTADTTAQLATSSPSTTTTTVIPVGVYSSTSTTTSSSPLPPSSSSTTLSSSSSSSSTSSSSLRTAAVAAATKTSSPAQAAAEGTSANIPSLSSTSASPATTESSSTTATLAATTPSTTTTTTSFQQSSTIATSTSVSSSSTSSSSSSPTIESSSMTTATSPAISPSPTSNVVPSSSRAGSVIPYNNEWSFDAGKYYAFWYYDTNTATLYIKIEVMARGWVAFGFSDHNAGMKDIDLVIAGVSAGQPYLGDYFATSTSAPRQDIQRDYTLIRASEQEGKTTIELKRTKLDTLDNKDVELVAGKSYYIVGAYHSSSDTPSIYHTARQYSPQKHIIIPTSPIINPSTTTPPSSTTPSSSATTTPSSTTTKPTTPSTTTSKLVEFSSGGGSCNVSWKHLPKTKEMEFTVLVSGGGWVGMGLNADKPSMTGMHCAVGGVKNGTGYLNGYTAQGQRTPSKHTGAIYTLISTSGAGGGTTLTFRRKLQIDGSIYPNIETGKGYHVICAYGRTHEFVIHSRRWYSSSKFVLVEGKNTDSSTILPYVSAVCLVFSLIISHLLSIA